MAAIVRRLGITTKWYWRIVWVALLLTLGYWLYLGWCWGALGQGSLWARYFLQCRCPAVAESARYPKRVELLVSACGGFTNVQLSPSGRFMSVFQGGPPMYLYDFSMSTRLASPTPDSFIFLTDNLLLGSNSREPGHASSERYIIDHATGERRYLTWLFADDLGGDYWEPDPVLMLPLLRNADAVYTIDDALVVLGGRVAEGAPIGDYYLSAGRWLNEREWKLTLGEQLRQFLDENHIVYTRSDRPTSSEFLSPSGRFIARRDGIYLTETGQRIVENYYVPQRGYSWPVGWIAGERGVVVRPIAGLLVDIIIDPEYLYFRKYPLAQPILLLEVPPEYLP